MDNNEWAKELDTRLPRDISFGGTWTAPTMSLDDRAVAEGNMQSDASAFEAWALALLVRPGVQKVSINWRHQNLAPLKNRHYQRFLYRADKFAQLMQGRVVLAHRAVVEATRAALDSRAPTLNVALGLDTSHKSSLSGSEAEAEKWFKTNMNPAREMLRSRFKLDRLCRQFPVGLYAGEPRGGASGTGIFAGGKSAIDLIGVDDAADVWIFELKVGGNNAIGGFSELLFYTMVLHDAQRARFAFSTKKIGSRAEVKPSDVKDAKRIHAVLLADQFHPLVGDEVLAVLNHAAAVRKWSVDFRKEHLKKYKAAARTIDRASGRS